MNSTVELGSGVRGQIEEGGALKRASLLVLASVITFLAMAGWSIAGAVAVVNTVDLSDEAFIDAVIGM